MRFIIFLVVLGATASASAFEPCATKMKNAAAYNFSQSLGVPVSKLEVLSFEMGPWTEAIADNVGTGKVSVAYYKKVETYNVSAQQIGTSADCEILNLEKLTRETLDSAMVQAEKYKMAIKDALYTSEGDAPWEIAYTTKSVSKNMGLEEVRQALGEGEDEPMSSLDHAEVLEMLDDYINYSSDPVDAFAYKNLKELLLSDFTELKIYEVGDIQVRVYLVGRRPDGRLVGLKTISIET